MTDAVHQIYAIRYAHHDRPSAENYLRGDIHDVIEHVLDDGPPQRFAHEQDRLVCGFERGTEPEQAPCFFALR